LDAASNPAVGLQNCAAVSALPVAIFTDAGNAPSNLLTRRGTPPASQIAIVTCHQNKALYLLHIFGHKLLLSFASHLKSIC